MARKKCNRNVLNTKRIKSVTAEKLIRTLKNKIYKYMNSMSMCILIN